ncbi:DUF6452 family protein [Constantimarinum furrinae]|uniref:Uncharacterized protein n=1 Tax=Constantimarinum furrinae TaxID=2562285 RepID=A0A7G8PX41_9FLAO|nr:DUF6452 family protein [Constantimarinum furrinae]QNJ98907.1 hypothetical protein ALE3EI_2368 [Constantimarinum furrinae]
MIKRILFALALITIFNGCTRDDICAEETATTPLLIITFKDSNNPLLPKSVNNLTIESTDANNVSVFVQNTTDSIAIPLKVNANNTEFLFIKNDGTSSENTDTVNFTYTREDIYVNRACAFKTVYAELSATVENEGTTNWINTLNVINTTIENETAAHITIFH